MNTLFTVYNYYLMHLDLEGPGLPLYGFSPPLLHCIICSSSANISGYSSIIVETCRQTHQAKVFHFPQCIHSIPRPAPPRHCSNIKYQLSCCHPLVLVLIVIIAAGYLELLMYGYMTRESTDQLPVSHHLSFTF